MVSFFILFDFLYFDKYDVTHLLSRFEKLLCIRATLRFFEKLRWL